MTPLAWRRSIEAVRSRRSVILCHHGVAPSTSEEDPYFLRVDPDSFREQLELMLDAGFELVTVAELAELADGGTPPPGYAAISFDDGMQDNHSVALPILEHYGVPATVYVTTGLIGQANPFMSAGSSARMMTELELRDLASAGIELGAHTVTHPDMSRMDRESCVREMVESREALERVAGEPVKTFAYPFCRYGTAARAAARDAGFVAAVTCGGRGSWDRFEMGREIITRKDGLPSFALKLAGLYQPLFDSLPGRAFRASTRDIRARARSALERR